MLHKTLPLGPGRARAWVRALVAAVATLVLLTAAVPARAAAPVPFTITDNVNDNTNVSTFVATAPLCASGTFQDDVKVAAFAQSPAARSDSAQILIRSVLTCDDRSGTFTLLKHLHLTFTADGFTDSGPVEILGGTGGYAGIAGHGFTTGSTSASTGLGGGTTSGVISL